MDKKQIKLNRFIEKIRIKLDTEKWYLWIDEENRAIGEAEAGALFQLVKIKILGFYWGNKEKHAVLYTPALGQTQHLEFSNTIFFSQTGLIYYIIALNYIIFHNALEKISRGDIGNQRTEDKQCSRKQTWLPTIRWSKVSFNFQVSKLVSSFEFTYPKEIEFKGHFYNYIEYAADAG